MDSRERLYYVQLEEEIFGPFSLDTVRGLNLMHDVWVLTTDRKQWNKAMAYRELVDTLDFDNITNEAEHEEAETVHRSRPVNNYSIDQLRRRHTGHIGSGFTPSADYYKFKKKRKAAIIGVCTLGLTALTIVGIRQVWKGNIFAGTSMMKNDGMAFVLKCFSFFLFTALLAIPFFIYCVFALIYYSVKINKLKARGVSGRNAFYSASRVSSEGNALYPDAITYDRNTITFYKGRPTGYETIVIPRYAVNAVYLNSGILFSDIIISTGGEGNITAKGFKKSIAKKIVKNLT